MPAGVTAVSALSTSLAGAGATPAVTFSWTPPGPTALTGPTSQVSATAATLNGTVVPNGSAVSDCHFTITPPAPAGAQVSCSPTPGSGSAPVAVSAALSGLTPSTSYSVTLVVGTAQGQASGQASSFTTSAPASTATPAVTTAGSSAGGGSAGGQSPGAGSSAPALTTGGPTTTAVLGSGIVVHDGQSVGCPAGGAACAARLVVTVPAAAPTAGRKHARKPAAKTVVIASSTLALGAGTARGISFTLNAAGRKLLAARGKLTATVTVTVTYAGTRSVVFTHVLVLHRPKAAHTKGG